MLRKITRTLAVLGGLFCNAALPAADHSQHGMADPARAAQAELGATAAFDARGILWAAHKDAGFIAVSQSADRGKTWSQPVRVNAVLEETDPGGDARPKIALGPGGELFVTWTKPYAKPHTGAIRFARSLDGGKTFSAPVTVHTDAAETTHRFDNMAVNKKGQLFVTWIDKRDGIAAAAAKTPYRGAAVYFAVSDDLGATFRGDYKLAGNACECCRIGLTSRADGSVTAMWRHIFEPNIRDHAVAEIPADGSAAAVRRASFDDWRIDACPHHGPSIAEEAGGRLHAVWFTLAPKSEGAFYGRLRDGGVDLQRRIGGETAAHPDLALIGHRVAVAWTEFDGERCRLRAMVSENSGETWREHELASTAGMYDQPRVLTAGNAFHVFWNTRNEPLSVTPIPSP
ncbi:MAG TPA: sialidase family protein [Opitutaceae bacterium]|nr:sialidase family protein [Opitutaceae bacterium]